MKLAKVITVLSCMYFASCSSDVVPPLASINQLENAGAVMPVHIHGNMESRTAIIVVHGGPGNSAILQREATGFYQLEADHTVVYYDQRGSGISEGNAGTASLTVEQMSEDLTAVVALVEAGTQAESIFIVSLDWGAAVAVQYLASGPVSEKIKGFIAVSPGINGPLTMERSRQEMVDIAEELLNDGTAVNDAAASNILAFYESNPVINRFNYEEHFRLLETVGGIVINFDHGISGVVPPDYVESQLDNNRALLLRHWSYRGGHFLEELDLDSELAELEVPVKMIWGIFDRLMPASFAPEYAALLGSASSEELISLFPASANRPYLEEGDRFFALSQPGWISTIEG